LKNIKKGELSLALEWFALANEKENLENVKMLYFNYYG